MCQQAGRVATLRASAHLHKIQLVLQLNHSAIVNVVVPALLQLELEALDFLQELRVRLLQLAALARLQLQSFASMCGRLLCESFVLLRQPLKTLLELPYLLFAKEILFLQSGGTLFRNALHFFH